MKCQSERKIREEKRTVMTWTKVRVLMECSTSKVGCSVPCQCIQLDKHSDSENLLKQPVIKL